MVTEEHEDTLRSRGDKWLVTGEESRAQARWRGVCRVCGGSEGVDMSGGLGALASPRVPVLDVVGAKPVGAEERQGVRASSQPCQVYNGLGCWRVRAWLWTSTPGAKDPPGQAMTNGRN